MPFNINRLIKGVNLVGFMDSYKRLEKLCGDVLNDDRRISAYIDEMLSTVHAEYFVAGWNEDLKKLKHYRWIRNQIVHNPDFSEDSCTDEDVRWIDNFYNRIMRQTDPLALYREATKPKNKPTPKPVRERNYYDEPQNSDYNNGSIKLPDGCTVAFVYGLILIALIAIWYAVLK